MKKYIKLIKLTALGFVFSLGCLNLAPGMDPKPSKEEVGKHGGAGCFVVGEAKKRGATLGSATTGGYLRYVEETPLGHRSTNLSPVIIDDKTRGMMIIEDALRRFIIGNRNRRLPSWIVYNSSPESTEEFQSLKVAILSNLSDKGFGPADIGNSDTFERKDIATHIEEAIKTEFDRLRSMHTI